MATINNDFLDAFRALDTELKYENKTVLDYENSLASLEQEQLKACRIMRNYMAHNDMNFMTASREQIKFLQNQVNDIRKSSKLVKDVMKKIKIVSASTLIKDIISLVDKYSYAPVAINKELYLVDKDILIHQLALGNKKIIAPAKLPKYRYMDKMTRLDNVVPNLYIVTSDGTASGEYLGVLEL